MRKPVFRSQIAALAGRSAGEQRHLVREAAGNDSKLRSLQLRLPLIMGVVIGLNGPVSRHLFHIHGLAAAIGVGLATGLALGLPLVVVSRLFFINPRLKEILDR